MAAGIVAYRGTSFLGHRAAYMAGQRIHNTILETGLVAMLATPHTNRIPLVSPAKLLQTILSSAKTSAYVVVALLTEVFFFLLCATLALIGILLHMSVKLTLIIGLVLGGSELVLQQLRQHHQNCKKELAMGEADVQVLAINALQRSAIIRVVHAKLGILDILQRRLQRLAKTN
ncbi:ABC transporter-like protein [Trypanosoma rangeli]|uniref:ABC transporter-like protein n=1 Tax=Trypanosoma rangeli TaxID=5698 RepID=A0A3R7N7X1_TRYRA|nr:ABC transporter-like protein [Trypanosoma rangeli]RNE98124.1 ABC transporter-like protein [Trypanosoma rangeli]|eukprot:RNE98124.1 ABC transporter-like protein [Trypanosoma rangeli]